MTKGRYIAVLVLAGLTGVVAAVVIVAAVSFRGLSPRTELTAEERSLLVQVDDLVPFGVVPRQGRFSEGFRAKTNVDHSLELEYAYQSEDADAPFALRSEAEICRTEEAASESLQARVSAYRMGVRMAAKKGTALHDQPAPEGVGIGTYASQIRVGGKPAGCALVTRRGRTVFSVLLSGLYIEGGEDWAAVLGPRLAKEGCVSVGTP